MGPSLIPVECPVVEIGYRTGGKQWVVERGTVTDSGVNGAGRPKTASLSAVGSRKRTMRRALHAKSWQVIAIVRLSLVTREYEGYVLRA